MNIILSITLSFLAGIALGYLFFWGLWKTVEHMPHVNNPYLWIFASFFIRTTIVLLGFYLLLQIQWQLIAVALFGFIFARILVMRYNKKQSRLTR